MRKTVVAGNWKMNVTLPEGQSFISDLKKYLAENKPRQVEVMIFPTFPLLPVLLHEAESSGIIIGAQNCHHEAKGAFTGEVSAAIIRSSGVKWVIAGHSERRKYFNEGNDLLASKIDMAFHYGLNVVYCCGETIEERKAGNHKEIIRKQISEGLFHLTSEDLKNLIIAYEPVWAIGTGETASPAQAQEMHEFIRGLIREKYGEETAEEIHILYGGSVKPENAGELFSRKDIDGGLIGGASLKTEDFTQIITASAHE